jgi:hypothetical protein
VRGSFSCFVFGRVLNLAHGLAHGDLFFLVSHSGSLKNHILSRMQRYFVDFFILWRKEKNAYEE